MHNYGTIRVDIHPGMSEDQLLSVVKNAVENASQIRVHEHRNEILNQCFNIVKTTSSYSPFSVTWRMDDAYTYTFTTSLL